jgi:hypothetical protein
MKNLLSVLVLSASFLTLVAPALSQASDGKTEGCFKIAVGFPSALDGSGDESLLPTGGELCSVEKNLNPQDPDGMIFTGDITITIKSASGKVIQSYSLGAVEREGAAGTLYSVMGKTASDVSNVDPNKQNQPIILFRMRNDHIKAGEDAGSVRFPFGSPLRLIQE